MVLLSKRALSLSCNDDIFMYISHSLIPPRWWGIGSWYQVNLPDRIFWPKSRKVLNSSYVNLRSTTWSQLKYSFTSNSYLNLFVWPMWASNHHLTSNILTPNSLTKIRVSLFKKLFYSLLKIISNWVSCWDVINRLDKHQIMFKYKDYDTWIMIIKS